MLETLAEYVVAILTEEHAPGDTVTASHIWDLIGQELDTMLIYTRDILDYWLECDQPEPTEFSDSITGSMIFSLHEYAYENTDVEELATAAELELLHE